MCSTTDRLRETALRLAHCEGKLPQMFMASDAYLKHRARLRLLEAAKSFAPEYSPILDALIAAERCHPSDYDGHAEAYSAAESEADTLARQYRRMSDGRE